MDADVLQVSPGLPAVNVADAMSRRGAERALVVDGDGKPLGIVMRDCMPHTGTAAGAMKPLTITLHASVPISVAASIMATSETGAIAVVSDERRAIGIVSWRELLAWVASEAGHRHPEHVDEGGPTP